MLAQSQDAPKGAFADELRCKVVKVYVGGQDVGLRQIYDGLAWRYCRYAHEQSAKDRQDYEKSEREARLNRRNLWLDSNAVPPWDWR